MTLPLALTDIMIATMARSDNTHAHTHVYDHIHAHTHVYMAISIPPALVTHQLRQG